jgi:hypothetical protein
MCSIVNQSTARKSDQSEVCGNDKLTPNLVGIVSIFQNFRSTLLLPFHSVSYAYLPPPRGTLTGMFNAWVWSLATVNASGGRFDQVSERRRTRGLEI